MPSIPLVFSSKPLPQIFGLPSHPPPTKIYLDPPITFVSNIISVNIVLENMMLNKKMIANNKNISKGCSRFNNHVIAPFALKNY